MSAVILLGLLMSACGNDDSPSQEDPRFDIERYKDAEVAATTLSGTWMVVADADYRFTSDASGEPVINRQAKMRFTLSLRDNGDGTADYFICDYASAGAFRKSTNSAAGELLVEAFGLLFPLSIVNNTRLEGAVEAGSSTLEVYAGSSAAVKMLDATGWDEAVVLGSLGLQVCGDLIPCTEERAPDFGVLCVAQMDAYDELRSATGSDIADSVSHLDLLSFYGRDQGYYENIGIGAEVVRDIATDTVSSAALYMTDEVDPWMPYLLTEFRGASTEGLPGDEFNYSIDDSERLSATFTINLDYPGGDNYGFGKLNTLTGSIDIAW